MRIARVMTRLNLGGPARQALAADPLLCERGHQVRLLVGSPEPGEGDLFAHFAARGADVVRVPGLRRGIAPLRDAWVRLQLGRELRSFRPDVVHTHASKAGLLGRRAARTLAGVRTVHTFHGHVLEGYFSQGASRALIAAERRLAAGTDRVVAVSHATAADLVRLGVVRQEQLTVVVPGIDLAPLARVGPRSNHLRRSLGIPAAAYLVGVVGRLAAVKRPQLAVEVFELLADRYPGLELVFVGDGAERRRLKRRILAGRPPVRARVHLAGIQSNMAAVLSDLDAVLLTSRSEGMPVSLIEAAAAGKPAVSTPVGGVPELVEHQRTGFLGEDVTELAQGLAQLMDNPAESKNMGVRARMRATARHGAQSLAERLENLYRAVLEGTPCGS